MKKVIKSLLPRKVILKYRSYKVQKEKEKEMLWFKGNQVTCPICESSYKIFADYGLVTRTNSKCHNCGSVERHRLLYLYLTETINIFDKNIKPTRVLHFAPEKIFYNLIDKNSNVTYKPCDLMPEFYQFSGTSKVTKADITDIPFDDDSFDVILCNHVLEHIPDDHLAMTELNRVLSQDGDAIFMVPIDYSKDETYEDWTITSPEGREKAFGQDDHVRWYGNDFKTRLEKAGFKVNEVDFASNFSEEDVFKYGFAKNDRIYHCKK